MFHLCRYLCKLYSSINTPGFPWCFLPVINYPVQIQFVPALCSEFCTLLYHSYFVSFQFWDADTLKAWTIKFNCVTETEHISDKCLLSKWRLLDDLRVCNGPLKNTSVLPGWEKWEKHSKQSYTWGKLHLLMWQAMCHLIKHICGSSNLIYSVELTCRTPWIHVLYKHRNRYDRKEVNTYVDTVSLHLQTSQFSPLLWEVTTVKLVSIS